MLVEGLQLLSTFSFSNLLCRYLQLTNQIVSLVFEHTVLDGVCHLKTKLTVELEATAVYDNLLGPPQAQYCVL